MVQLYCLAHRIIFSATAPWKDDFCSFHQIAEAETIRWIFFSFHFDLFCGTLQYFGELASTCMKAQAHHTENKIKTGNSSMLCNKENKQTKSIVIFSSANK